MGNTESNVTSGVKKQADTSSVKVYQLVDLKGGGSLVEMTKKAQTNKNASAELDLKICELVAPFVYNGGEGKKIPIQEIVLERNKDRPPSKRVSYFGGPVEIVNYLACCFLCRSMFQKQTGQRSTVPLISITLCLMLHIVSSVFLTETPNLLNF